MKEAFDQAYSRYRSSLAKLDTTHDISEKNVLFKQLAEQLSAMEHRINTKILIARHEESAGEESEMTYWI